jgi:predicted phosphodiesterase
VVNGSFFLLLEKREFVVVLAHILYEVRGNLSTLVVVVRVNHFDIVVNGHSVDAY